MSTTKIIVCVKRVLDFTLKPRVKADKSGVDRSNLKHSMNPFDEIAVEEALRLKEKGRANDVLALSIGSTTSQETLRTALAMGCDRAIHINTNTNDNTDDEFEPLLIAKLISKIAEKEKPGLIFLGKQSIDADSNQTGQMLAGILNWPQATFASEVKIEKDNKLFVKREVDGGLQNLMMTLPAVVTADLRLNQPRFATLKNIMAAKKKKIDVVDAKEFGIELKNRTKIVEYEEPPKRKSGKLLKDVDELIHKLKNEAAVIG